TRHAFLTIPLLSPFTAQVTLTRSYHQLVQPLKVQARTLPTEHLIHLLSTIRSTTLTLLLADALLREQDLSGLPTKDPRKRPLLDLPGIAATMKLMRSRPLTASPENTYRHLVVLASLARAAVDQRTITVMETGEVVVGIAESERAELQRGWAAGVKGLR